MPPVIDMKKCKKCGTCDLHCPLDVIHFDRERRFRTSSIRTSVGIAVPAALTAPWEPSGYSSDPRCSACNRNLPF